MARDQKDDPLEGLIGQRLADGRGSGGAQCPDASIIVAYRERALGRDQRAQCERHFAQCARCAGALAALARIDDAVEHGGVVAVTRSAGNESRVWWRLRGPLPLAAFGAVAAIVIVVAIRSFSTPRGQIAVEARSELPTKSLAANAASEAANSGSGGAESAGSAGAGAVIGSNGLTGSNSFGGSNSLLAMNQPAPAMPASPPLQKSLAQSVPPPPPAEAASTAAQRVQPPPAEAAPFAQHDQPARHELAQIAREQARNSARDELRETNPPARELDRQTAEIAAAPAAGGAAGVNGGGAGVGGAVVGGAASSALSAMAAAIIGPLPGANAIVVEPPDHTVVWMVGAHGAISRYSAATGWVAQTSGATVDLSGGSAPSVTTCWIVGRAGTILRTIDGERWTAVVAPVSEDLSGVVASSASDATIFTASGRRFATSDGGATWRPL